ncbi:hypothetical protein FH968_11905 [Buttiauxella sp. B2]|uniref:hypothetical protein n=1 Tax=Buttiauxella sp. B2 TaxID=2587812 RepID=UPI001120811C|nr:hypothetical protein [Buttiauxella sp. B2]TNV19920.1 hypothetical protein FH968_11905 [Buttiauxella sp. B2]
MTKACFSITKFDKIRLFHNIISGLHPASYLHKNSFKCIIMLSSLTCKWVIYAYFLKTRRIS